MNNNRFIFALALGMFGYLLWQQWQSDYYSAPVAPTSSVAEVTPVASSTPQELPTSTAAAQPSSGETPPSGEPLASANAPVSEAKAGQVRVITDLFDLDISLAGADIQRAQLRRYPIALGATELVTLVDAKPQTHWLKTQSGLTASAGKAPSHLDVYQSPASSVTMNEGQATLEVPFLWQDASGVQVRKIYRFERGSYAISVRFEVNNSSGAPWSAFSYRQLQQIPPEVPKSSFFSSPAAFSFIGSAIYSNENKFEKLAFGDYPDEPLNRGIVAGWMALLRHHFFVAWIPPAAQANQYSTVVLEASGQLPTRYLIRQASPQQTVAAGATARFESRLYIGPKMQSTLDSVAPGLAKTIDYGKVTIFSEPLFWLLDQLHSLTNNWGWAIVLLVLLIKIVFYKLSEIQFRSGARMKLLAPKLEEIKRRHADDRQKQAQAQMELFAKEKVNPLAGCFPILLQFPIFIGLYWVLADSVELRQAPFIFWLKDLTAADPYFVLPVLNAAVMYVTQRMTPMTGIDPIQQKVFQFMPLIFGVMMAFFPSGLVLYWTLNGLLGLAQQLYITRKIEREGTNKKALARA